MKDKEFTDAINQIKKMGIVSHINEPVILKHNIPDGKFEQMADNEIMRIFNDIYTGNNDYSIEDIKKELVVVDVSYQ